MLRGVSVFLFPSKLGEQNQPIYTIYIYYIYILYIYTIYILYIYIYCNI